MPDLERRRVFEDQLTTGLSRVMSLARQRLVTAVYREGFTVGQLANIPPDVLEEMRQELERLFKDRLDDVFVEAAQAYAGQLAYSIDEAVLRETAQRWSDQYAPLLASQIVTTTRVRISDIVRRSPDVPITRRNLLGLLILALGITRATMIAITEVTNAISKGEEAVNQDLQRNNVSVTTIWYTQKDERVCPVCAPRHGRLQGSNWTFPPPAHPRCRCYTGYRVVSVDGTVTILFDDENVARRLQRART